MSNFSSQLDPPRSAYLRRIDDPEEKSLMSECVTNNMLWATTFHPDWFDDPMTDFNREAWSLYDNELAHRIVFCTPRGSQKTTNSAAYVCKNACFRMRNFVVWVSQTLAIAEQWTENIRSQLMTNAKIRDYFGKMTTKKFEDTNVSQSKRCFNLCDPRTGEPFMTVVPKGAEQQMRGMNASIGGRLVRPNLIVIDDPENSKEIGNEENRKAFRDWLHDSLMNCVDTKRPYAWQYPKWEHARQLMQIYGKNAAMHRIVYNDTLKHKDAQIAHLLEDPYWKHCRQAKAEVIEKRLWLTPEYKLALKPDVADRAYKFFNDNPNEDTFYASNAPELIPDWQIAQEIGHAKKSNTLKGYFQENMGKSMPGDMLGFDRAMFQYYNDGEKGLSRNDNLFKCVVYDPARSGEATANYSAITAFGIDTEANRIYVRKSLNERMRPLEMHKKAFNLCAETNSHFLAVDETGLKDHIKQVLMDMAAQCGQPIRFLWLKNQTARSAGDFGTGKEAPKRARGSQIIPYYEGLHVWHDLSLKDGTLEGQLLSYPECGNWDAIDTVGYVPQIMAELGIHFTLASKPPAGQASFADHGNDTDEERQRMDIVMRRWARI